MNKTCNFEGKKYYNNNNDDDISMMTNSEEEKKPEKGNFFYSQKFSKQNYDKNNILLLHSLCMKIGKRKSNKPKSQFQSKIKLKKTEIQNEKKNNNMEKEEKIKSQK